MRGHLVDMWEQHCSLISYHKDGTGRTGKQINRNTCLFKIPMVRTAEMRIMQTAVFFNRLYHNNDAHSEPYAFSSLHSPVEDTGGSRSISDAGAGGRRWLLAGRGRWKAILHGPRRPPPARRTPPPPPPAAPAVHGTSPDFYLDFILRYIVYLILF